MCPVFFFPKNGYTFKLEEARYTDGAIFKCHLFSAAKYLLRLGRYHEF